LFDLAFLPHEHINVVNYGFVDLISTDNHTFTDHILENFIINESQFSLTVWAAITSLPKNTTTINRPVAFHKNFNSLFYHLHPNIYTNTLCSWHFIINIQTETELKIKSENKNQLNNIKYKESVFTTYYQIHI